MNQALSPSRNEVMLFLEKEVETTGLNYLSGFSDEVENSERRKKEKEEENDR